MRWCGIISVFGALGVLAAACNRDPSLAITVHHKAGYAVKQTLITVYVGTVGIEVSCSAIELGDLTDTQLAATTVDEVDAASGDAVQVSRLGGKSIVARGYDAQHRFVTAGCKDLGEIAGATRVEIDTEPTATVAIDPGQADRPFTGRDILINMTDANGKPIDGAVSWQLTGPVGASQQTVSAGTPTRNGNLKVQVNDLGIPGPEGLRIRAPWAIAPLPLVTGFDLSHQSTVMLTGGSLGGNPSCDVRGHTGKPPTLVCLTPANVQGHRDAVEIAWQGGHYVATPVSPPIPSGINNQFALFVDHDGTADEPVYVLGATAAGAGTWYKLGAASARSVTFASALQNVVYLPRCAENSVKALVAVQTGTALGVANQVQLFTADGTPGPVGPSDGEVFSGGCIHDVDHHEHQGLVASSMEGEAILELIVPGAVTPLSIPSTKLTGSGFVTMVTQGMTEKRLAGTRLQAEGTVVFESVLAPDAGSFKLVERTEVDTAAPPGKIISGKLDGDGDSDLMWDMAVGARRRLFQVSLAEQVGGAPLTAMTSGPAGPGATTAGGALDFAAADLNGRGTDEMIVFSASSVVIYSPDE